MNGREEREIQLERKIEMAINQNNNMPYLIGYYHFLNDMAKSSIYTYINYVINFMKWCKKDVKDLTMDDYTSYLFSLKRTTSAYQIAVYSALKKFSAYLKANGTNPADGMQYIKRPKAIESQKTKDRREKAYLKEGEIEQYISNVKKGSRKKYKNSPTWQSRDMLIVLLFLNTGMRASALCAINIEDINFDEQELYVTDKGSKVIKYYLPDALMPYLTDWIEKRAIFLNGTEEDALFISNRKDRMQYITLYHIIRQYASDIEGKIISPHKLRATYGTTLYEETRDIVFVQKAMNHNSSHTTELYIRGKNDSSKVKAAGIMSKFIV